MTRRVGVNWVPVALLIFIAIQPANGQTVSWKGISWTNVYPSNSISVDAGGTLSVFTGDASVGYFGGAYHATPSALQTANEAWAEATFFDTGSIPGPQINVLYFDSLNSAFLASLGAFQAQGQYSAYWRRDSQNPSDVVVGTSVDVGPRSLGTHTVRIGRRSDGRLEFWLDGKLVQTSGTNTFPANFNFVYLVAAGTAQGQSASFTDYQEGTGSGPLPPPNVTLFSDRPSWQNTSSGLNTIGFEGLAAAGGFVLYDNAAGLTADGVNFTGLTPITGLNGPALYYLRVVDPAFFPPFYDWGSGTVLHGPPIPVGPQGEGGPNSRIHVTLPSGVTSVGTDFMSFLQYASPFTIVASTVRGSIKFHANSSQYPTRGFVGLMSDSPIISLDYYALNGFPVLDNFSFGNAVAPPVCPYSLSPTGTSFEASPHIFSFTVTTAPGCTWTATPSDTWITILPSGSLGTGTVNYAAAANNGGARTGTISVGGQIYTIHQQGPSCSYSISPTVAAFGANGGDSRVVVTAQAGCSWSTMSNSGWLSVTSGASGAGSEAVTVHAAANTGGSRSGTVTIAGQTLSVTQAAPGANACGALDVTSQVNVSRGGYSPISPAGSNLWHQQVTITNNSGAAINGPLFYVLIGLPTPSGVGLTSAPPSTFCFSSKGDSYVYVSAGLPSGAHIVFGLDFVDQFSGFPSYTPKVLSGQPSK
jgi:hypothetical protein